MKMKKLIMLVALLAAGAAQADSLNWGGGANPGGGTTAWTNSLSWWSQDATAWGAVPTSNDIVYIDQYFGGGLADTSAWIPTLDAAGWASNVVLN